LQRHLLNVALQLTFLQIIAFAQKDAVTVLRSHDIIDQRQTELTDGTIVNNLAMLCSWTE